MLNVSSPGSNNFAEACVRQQHVRRPPKIAVFRVRVKLIRHDIQHNYAIESLVLLSSQPVDYGCERECAHDRIFLSSCSKRLPADANCELLDPVCDGLGAGVLSHFLPVAMDFVTSAEQVSIVNREVSIAVDPRTARRPH